MMMLHQVFDQSNFENKVYPDLDEIVAIRVTKKGEMGIYCDLLDYGNIEVI